MDTGDPEDSAGAISLLPSGHPPGLPGAYLNDTCSGGCSLEACGVPGPLLLWDMPHRTLTLYQRAADPTCGVLSGNQRSLAPDPILPSL